MKICYLASLHVPSKNASGIQITQTCNAFAKIVDSVEIILLRYARDTEAVHSYYGLTGVSVKNVLPFGFAHVFRFLVRIEVLLALLIASFSIRKKSDRVVYSREPLVAFFFKPFILETHVIPEVPGFINAYAYRNAQKIVCISHGLKKRFIELGIPDEKISVAADAVDLERYKASVSRQEAKEQCGMPLNKRAIVYTGSLQKNRGAEMVPLFLSQLPEDCFFYIVGDTDEYVTTALGGLSNVVCVGRKPHHEIPLWQKAADVLVLFNSAKIQMFKEFTSPMKLFEYMASGTPILASDLPSTREVLNEQSAVLVDPDDPKAYVAGLKRILSDGEFAQQIAQQALRDVESFTWDKRAANIIAFLGSK